jgi:hypothetical protein
VALPGARRADATIAWSYHLVLLLLLLLLLLLHACPSLGAWLKLYLSVCLSHAIV